MHQAIRAGNAEIAKAISPIDICSHRRCAMRQKRFERYLTLTNWRMKQKRAGKDRECSKRYGCRHQHSRDS